jgi:hypothetical protein
MVPVECDHCSPGASSGARSGSRACDVGRRPCPILDVEPRADDVSGPGAAGLGYTPAEKSPRCDPRVSHTAVPNVALFDPSRGSDTAPTIQSAGNCHGVEDAGVVRERSQEALPALVEPTPARPGGVAVRSGRERMSERSAHPRREMGVGFTRTGAARGTTPRDCMRGAQNLVAGSIIASDPCPKGRISRGPQFFNKLTYDPLVRQE